MSPHASRIVEHGILESEKTRAIASQRPDGAMKSAMEVRNVSQSPYSRLQFFSEGPYDLVCVGFGPANLAIAIALHDALDAQRPPPDSSSVHRRAPKVLFIERQERFGWHPGMLLPGAKMQISFIKDLATLRDPRSEFTFLNYLHKHNRLAHFTNLDTFLPQRVEYEDYMRWCASTFEDIVKYGQEVTSVSPVMLGKDTAVNHFCIETKESTTGIKHEVNARNVVIAVGGKPMMPCPFPDDHGRILHSSRYKNIIGSLLDDKLKPYTVVVVGSGQSAAEIFNDLHSRYPSAKTRLLIRGAALKPSDDSPFVNEIFDPDQVDPFYSRPPNEREAALRESRGTNYGVVRRELLQQIYDHLYMQRLERPHQADWQHCILKRCSVTKVEPFPCSVRIHVRDLDNGTEEVLDADVVIVAAGYTRDMHETILDPVRHLTADGIRFEIGRNYKIRMGVGKVSEDAGIWLQGCNEESHGVSSQFGAKVHWLEAMTDNSVQLSDTLLSILATRSGHMIESIFGNEQC